MNFLRDYSLRIETPRRGDIEVCVQEYRLMSRHSALPSVFRRLSTSLLFCVPLGIAFLLAGCTMPEVRTAEQLAQEGNWDGAVAAYREAMKKQPFDEELKERLEECKEKAGAQHYTAGREHLKEHRLPEALHELKLAVGYDPARGEHHVALGDALRLKEARDQLHMGTKLQELGRIEEALTAYERAVELDPNLTKALEGITTLAAQQRAEKSFGGSSQPITLRFQNARMKEVFEILARAGGVNIVFDKDIRDDPLTIFIKDMPFDDALNLILNTNSMFARRISADTLLIIPNTKQKQDQYQDLMIRTFYLSNAKAKDVVNLLRTMLESKRVYVNELLNAVVIRDAPAKLRLAERIILANDRREPEVEFDLEVLEVNRTKSLKYGLNFAKSAGFGMIPPGVTGGVTTSPTQFTFKQLTDLGANTYLFTLPASVLLDFFKQDSDAKTLASPKIRVLNNQKASVSIGDKQPILLSTTNVLPGQAATGAVPTTSTVTSIEFKDTGVKLTVEPTIHLVDELTLKLKVEVIRLGDQVTLQASPEIKQFRFGTRTAETILNIKDSESVVLAGLIQDDERKTRVNVPILGDIPIIGNLFSSTTLDTIQTEVVLTITPRIIRSLSVPDMETQAFWSGTEGAYSTTPMFAPLYAKQDRGTVTDIAMKSAPEKARRPSPGPSAGPPAPAAPGPAAAPAVTPGLPSPPIPSPSATLPAGAPLPPSPGAVTQPPPTVVAKGGPVFSFRPSELSTLVGQEVRLDLSADQLGAFTESILTVGFDPNILELRQALEGEVLKRAIGAASMTASGDPSTGQVELRIRRQGDSGAGNGVLATLVLRAKAAGSSPILLKKSVVSGSDGKPVPVTSSQAVVRVR